MVGREEREEMCVRWEGETREGMWGGLKGGKGRVCDGERISRESEEERNVPE